MRFVDLFAGLGGFHVALERLGGECVHAVELDAELRALYAENFSMSKNRLSADIAESWSDVPAHDVLCAGFPCQPFSKSGLQLGFKDATRGSLFEYVMRIVQKRRPRLVLLENVGNFERHDGGNTWRVVSASLRSEGYTVYGTEHRASGGSGLLSPHQLGFPQVRERFFAVAARDGFKQHPLMDLSRIRELPDLAKYVTSRDRLTTKDLAETLLSTQQEKCIELWNEFIRSVPHSEPLPSFPIWADEFNAKYPTDRDLTTQTAATLRSYLDDTDPLLEALTKQELLRLFPAYMSRGGTTLPRWKTLFLDQNRALYHRIRHHLNDSWLHRLQELPPSLRKLEWNCKGEERDLWKHVLQFRPSGLRAKRYETAPALVAMTTTQIPILGPERRFLTRNEGKRLQGFPLWLKLPEARGAAFKALGNAVHVGVAEEVYLHALRALRMPKVQRLETTSQRTPAARTKR